MTLVVDVGNSAIKWARLSVDGLQPAHAQLHRCADLAKRLADQWGGDVPPDAPVVACNVAGPEVVAAVEEAARGARLRTVRWLQSQPSLDGPVALANGYRNPAQLGADRWHCMLGACSSANRDVTRSLVIVNAGTATTIDCVAADAESGGQGRFVGKFVGGVIAPGVRLMLESLALRTAGLPHTEVALSDVAEFPDNTEAAIHTGVLDAQAGLVYRVWHRFAGHLRAEPRLILTGGQAEVLVARLSIAADIEHNLVLRGLALRAKFDL